MTLEQLIQNYENYIIRVFPKGRKNTPVKYNEKYYNREVKAYIEYDGLRVLFVHVE